MRSPWWSDPSLLFLWRGAKYWLTVHVRLYLYFSSVMDFIEERAKFHRNRRIRLTCLYQRCHPIQIMCWFIWKITIDRLSNLSHATECMRVCTNKTMVTSQINNHLIWIGWQQGGKHLSRVRLCTWGLRDYSLSRKTVNTKPIRCEMKPEKMTDKTATAWKVWI